MSAVQLRFRLCRVRPHKALGAGVQRKAHTTRWIHAPSAGPRMGEGHAAFATKVQQLHEPSRGGDGCGSRRHQPIALSRAARRETLRAAVFLWTTPFCAVRTRMGSAAASALRAAALSPAAKASSTLRTCDLNCERRALLISVRRSILRAAFLAEVVLAIRPPPMTHRWLGAPGGAVMPAAIDCHNWRGQ